MRTNGSMQTIFLYMYKQPKFCIIHKKSAISTMSMNGIYGWNFVRYMNTEGILFLWDNTLFTIVHLLLEAFNLQCSFEEFVFLLNGSIRPFQHILRIGIRNQRNSKRKQRFYSFLTPNNFGGFVHISIAVEMQCKLQLRTLLSSGSK